MSIQNLKTRLPDFAKDARLNISKVMSEEGAPGLAQNQIYMIGLACSYATKQPDVIRAMLGEVSASLSPEEINAAKAAATLMAMNNVYYRFLHLSSDKSFGQMPANLRMNIIANPGIEKIDFELLSLAVSAINGCGMCLDSHIHEVVKRGLSKEGVQSAVRIAAVVMAVAQAVSIVEIAEPEALRESA